MIASSDQFTQVVYRALCACLSVDPESVEGAALVVPAYLEPEPPPRPPRTQNIVYFTVQSEDVQEERFQQYEDNRGFVIHSFLCYRLIVICYGPSAELNAHLIRSMIFIDGYGHPRYILRKAGIYPIPKNAQAVLLDELEGSLPRKRADLTVSIRVKDELTVTLPTVSVSPDVIIHTSP